jgi:hypothetical protein
MRKIPKRSSLLILIASLVSLLAVGCGDSGEDFVFTGTNNNNNNTTFGNVVFQFVTAQAATVPVETDTLAFDFYNTDVPAEGALIYTANSAFANTVTVLDVPVSARSVVITAYDADGHPLVAIIDELVVIAGLNNPTDLSNALVEVITFDSISVTPDPVQLDTDGNPSTEQQLVVSANFSNGETVVEPTTAYDDNGVFFSGNTDLVTVSATGLATRQGVAQGMTTIDVDYTIDGVTRSDFVNVEVGE